MTTINGVHAQAGWRTVDIECQDSMPVYLAFTGDARKIVSGERYSNYPGVGLRRYQLEVGKNSNQNAGSCEDQGTISIKKGIDAASVSNDGKWIISITGTKVMVSDTTTRQVAEIDEHSSEVPVHAIDVSPDSKKFASGSEDNTVRVFALDTRKMLMCLKHNNRVLGVKFSPNGEHLATAASGDPIRVWNARHGSLLFQSGSYLVYGPTVEPQATAQSSTCRHIPLGWSNDSENVFVISSGKIIRFAKPSTDASGMYYYQRQDRSLLSPSYFNESVPASETSTHYILATNGKTTACAAGGSLSFWDTFSFSRIGPTISFQDSILSIALSSDGSYLACGRSDKKITVYALRDFLPLLDILDPTSRLPLMNLSHAIFKQWIEQNLSAVDTGLWQELSYSQASRHHALANLALIRARLRQWHAAIENANQSLSTQPSIIGHIAKAVVLVGQGRHELALEGFDVVFCNCGADEIKFLLLIKGILLFLSGKRENAITRVNDIIAVADDSTKYNCLQVLGNMYLMQGDLERTVESFEHAQSLAFCRQGFHLVTILLMFGRSFEEHEISIRHPLRGAATA